MLSVKNLLLTLKNNCIMVMLLAVTQIFAVIAILLSYGVYYNNQYLLNQSQSLEKLFVVRFDGENWNSEYYGSKMSTVQKVIPQILSSYEKELSGCKLESYVLNSEMSYETYNSENGFQINSEFKFKNGRYIYGIIYENTSINTTNWFTEEDMNSGNNVCIVSNNIKSQINDELICGSEVYKVVGQEREGQVTSIHCDAIIPITALNDEMVPNVLYINFTRPITSGEYEDLANQFVDAFGPLVQFDEMYTVQIDEEATLKSTMLISVFVAFIAAYSACMIYRYVLKKRAAMTAVFRICGATTSKSVSVYFKEMLIMFGISTIIGTFLFIKLVEPELEIFFVFFSVIYESMNYVKLITVYFCIVLLFSLIMVFLLVRKTPKEMLRRAVK